MTEHRPPGFASRLEGNAPSFPPGPWLVPWPMVRTAKGRIPYQPSPEVERSETEGLGTRRQKKRKGPTARPDTRVPIMGPCRWPSNIISAITPALRFRCAESSGWAGMEWAFGPWNGCLYFSLPRCDVGGDGGGKCSVVSPFNGRCPGDVGDDRASPSRDGVGLQGGGKCSVLSLVFTAQGLDALHVPLPGRWLDDPAIVLRSSPSGMTSICGARS